MATLEIILGIVLALLAVAIIAVVLLQQGRRAGINGTISGIADTFLSKNESKSVDAKLKKLTVILGIAFVLIAIAATGAGNGISGPIGVFRYVESSSLFASTLILSSA